MATLLGQEELMGDKTENRSIDPSIERLLEYGASSRPAPLAQLHPLYGAVGDPRLASIRYQSEIQTILTGEGHDAHEVTRSGRFRQIPSQFDPYACAGRKTGILGRGNGADGE